MEEMAETVRLLRCVAIPLSIRLVVVRPTTLLGA
jgi:hypothetical protein